MTRTHAIIIIILLILLLCATTLLIIVLLKQPAPTRGKATVLATGGIVTPRHTSKPIISTRPVPIPPMQVTPIQVTPIQVTPIRVTPISTARISTVATSTSTTHPPTLTPGEEEAGPRWRNAGDTFQWEPFLMTVLGWRTRRLYDEWSLSEKTYLQVEVLLFNTDSVPQSISSGTTVDPFILYDPNGGRLQARRVSQGTIPDFQPLEGVVLPHSRMRGHLLFEVPKGRTIGPGMVLEVDAYNPFDASRTFVRLPDAPGFLPAPKTIPQDALTVIPMGRPIRVRDIVITTSKAEWKPVPDSDKEHVSPDRGILAVEITVENKGKEDVVIYETRQFYLRDGQGYVYEINYLLGLRDTLGTLDGTIPPDLKRRGWLVFTPFKDTSPYWLDVLYISPWGFGEISESSYVRIALGEPR